MKTVRTLSMALLVLIGCDNDTGKAITDNAVYTELNVRFDKTTNKTTGTAWFWQENKNGRWLIFDPDAVLKFQDNAMAYRSGDHSYFKELDNLQTPAVFVFTDINKKSFTNSIEVKQIDFRATDDLDTIDTAQPLTLTWNGAALDDDESVTLRIDNVGVTEDSTGKISVVFTAEKFSLLSSRKNTTVSMVIERTKNSSLRDNLGGGGFIRAEYVSQAKSVFLK